MLVIKRILFYLVSFTWGIVMSLIGLFAIVPFAIAGKTHIYHGRVYATVGKYWGGVSLGCFFLCDSYSSEHIKTHESGHGLQNCLYGPLMPFLVAIPSVIRYWYREYLYHKGITPKTDYDDIWFEGQATKWGEKFVLTDKI